MLNECQVWVDEIREVFPVLDKYIILADYGRVPKKAMSLVNSKIVRRTKKEIKQLSSISKNHVRIKQLRREYKVILSKELKELEDIALRRQIILYILVNKLMHIEKKDLLKLNSYYNRIKKRKVDSILLEEESLEKYNHLREKDNLPKVLSIQEVNLAINEVIER
tara:strand:+ start:725 stop:1219 length:495 start_codon:yes stop_codon:yes gene_type:complete